MSDALASPDTEDFWKAIEAQSQAAKPDQSAWVAANAGSGKTKVLIDRVARLLLRKAPPDSLLCVTYTKAAANEMMDRLFARLGAWSTMDTEKLGRELRQLEGNPDHIYSDEELKDARALFARALETPGGLRIETIHAFCARLLRRFPLEAGVTPGFNEIEDEEANRLWKHSVSKAIVDATPDALDRVALEGGGRGADFGLSELRSNRSEFRAFADLCGNDLERMEQSIRDRLGTGPDTVEAILHEAMETGFPKRDIAQAVHILNTGAKTDISTAEKLERAGSVLPLEERWRSYLSIFQTSSGGWRAANPYTKKSAETPLIPSLFQMKDGEGQEVTRVKQVASQVKSARMLARTRALLEVGLPAINHYRAAKRARGALDFDDLIAATKTLLTTPGKAEWALYKIDGGLTHVLLDEAQDTSPDQWTLLHALTEEFFAGQGVERYQDPRTLFVVGDEKQSIYSFQGAAPDRFYSEARVFETRCRQAEQAYAFPNMEMSFRSSPEILSFVDEVFNTDAFDGHTPFSHDPPPEADTVRHTARRANQPGLVELWPLEAPEEIEHSNPWDAPIDQLSAQSPKARLAEQVADQVRSLIDKGETVWEEGSDRLWRRRAATEEDVLILVGSRTGGLFESLIRAMKDKGLKVAGADRLRLTDHIGVQDCLNLIRFALLPEDDLTLAEILRGPFCNLYDDDIHLFPLAYGRGNASLWSQLKTQTDPIFEEAQAFCHGLLNRLHLPAYEYLSHVLDTPVFGRETGWARIAARLGSPARDPLEALLSLALEYDAMGPTSLQGFLSEIEGSEKEIKRDLSAPNGAIRVMTIHGAKGLQAPIVILPDTTASLRSSTDSVFFSDATPLWSPNKASDVPIVEQLRATARAADLAEHRRLLYVALTRAQDRLILAGAWNGQNKDGASKDSWYAICEAAMHRLGVTPKNPGASLQYGDPPPRLEALSKTDTAETPIPSWLNTSAPPSQAVQKPIAPSSLRPETSKLLPPLGPVRRAQLERGRTIHRLFEILPEYAPETRKQAARDYLEHTKRFDPQQIDEMMGAVFGVLENQAFADLFAPQGRSEVSIVGEVAALGTERPVSGIVDRMVVTDQDVRLIDFKSDRPAPADQAGVDDAYLAQLGAYKAVIEKAYPEKPARCYLVWTDGPKLMELDPARMLAALNRAANTL